MKLGSHGRPVQTAGQDVDALEVARPHGPLVGWEQRRTDVIREAAGFIGKPGDRIFAYAHVPTRPIRGSVLVCAPLLAESLITYRGDRRLATSLAERGIAAMRFHHRGSGQSEGSAVLYGLDQLVDDAFAAGERLSEISGRPVDAVIGTRLGATVAAQVARRLRVPRIALIAPIVDPKGYVREVFRGHLISEMKTRTTRLSLADLERSLAEDGWVDIVGYPVGRALVDSFTDRPVSEALVPPIRSALLIHLGKGQREQADTDALAVELTQRGIRTESASIPISLAWWFGGGGFTRSENEAAATGVNELVRAWLEKDLLR